MGAHSSRLRWKVSTATLLHTGIVHWLRARFDVGGYADMLEIIAFSQVVRSLRWLISASALCRRVRHGNWWLTEVGTSKKKVYMPYMLLKFSYIGKPALSGIPPLSKVLHSTWTSWKSWVKQSAWCERTGTAQVSPMPCHTVPDNG